MTIVAFSGSLRKGSYNTALVRAFQELASKDMKIEMAEIGNLPLYSQDDEAAYPAVVQALKDKVLAADGVIFVTPEYNRSVPGGLKNAIDWISRPYGTNAFAGKAVLIAGVSSGKIGTALAQSHLKEIMLYLDAVVIGQPEVYVGPAKDLFDENGGLVQEGTKKLLVGALETFSKRIERG